MFARLHLRAMMAKLLRCCRLQLAHLTGWQARASGSNALGYVVLSNEMNEIPEAALPLIDPNKDDGKVWALIGKGCKSICRGEAWDIRAEKTMLKFIQKVRDAGAMLALEGPSATESTGQDSFCNPIRTKWVEAERVVQVN